MKNDLNFFPTKFKLFSKSSSAVLLQVSWIAA